MSEKKIMHKIMLAASDVGVRMFRNHVGVAFQGKPQRFSEECVVKVKPGDVLIRGARTVTAGLITGSSDLIGWAEHLITEQDLGKCIARFTAIEVKSEDGELEPEQLHFLKVIQAAGGISIVARSPEEAIEKLKKGGGI